MCIDVYLSMSSSSDITVITFVAVNVILVILVILILMPIHIMITPLGDTHSPQSHHFHYSGIYE